MTVWNKTNNVRVEIINMDPIGNGEFRFFCVDEALNTYMLYRKEICTLAEHQRAHDEKIRRECATRKPIEDRQTYNDPGVLPRFW